LRTISEKVLKVLLEKRTTTYKQVSDIITTVEAKKLAVELSDYDLNVGGKCPANSELRRERN